MEKAKPKLNHREELEERIRAYDDLLRNGSLSSNQSHRLSDEVLDLQKQYRKEYGEYYFPQRK